MATLNIKLDDGLLERARRVADMDEITVEELAAAALRRHVEHTTMFLDLSADGPFLLSDRRLERVPDETDEEYAARRKLFE